MNVKEKVTNYHILKNNDQERQRQRSSKQSKKIPMLQNTKACAQVKSNKQKFRDLGQRKAYCSKNIWLVPPKPQTL